METVAISSPNSESDVVTLQRRVQQIYNIGNSAINKINDFYTLAMLLSLRRTGISSTSYSAAVRALSGFSSHVNSKDNIWPSCRNLFSYRVSISTPWGVIHNAPAVLVNAHGGLYTPCPLFNYGDTSVSTDSCFVLWVDKETNAISNLYNCDGHIRGCFGLPEGSSIGVIPFSSGIVRGRMAVTPDNRISDMRSAPKGVQPLIRFLRSSLASGTVIDSQSVDTFVAGEFGLLKDKTILTQTTKAGTLDRLTKAGIPGRLTNVRGLLRKRGIPSYDGQLLPLGTLCTKFKGRVRLHTIFPNASVLGMEPEATYTLGPKLARQVIPKVVEALSRTNFLSTRYAYGPMQELHTTHLGNGDSNALIHKGVYIGLGKYSKYINKLKRHSVIENINKEARGVIYQEYVALQSLRLYCIDDLIT